MKQVQKSEVTCCKCESAGVVESVDDLITTKPSGSRYLITNQVSAWLPDGPNLKLVPIHAIQWVCKECAKEIKKSKSE